VTSLYSRHLGRTKSDRRARRDDKRTGTEIAGALAVVVQRHRRSTRDPGNGFAHGDGWFNIVWRLCEGLEPLVAEAEKATGRPFEVLQVKQTFGGLRFYTNLSSEAIRERINAAGLESVRTCQVCGQPGRLREHGWIKIVCDEHG
jgi:hypothetical protein